MRTKNNGELRIENVGEKVTLVGWCAKSRDLGGLLFIDLRDRHGITQLAVKPENPCYEIACSVKNEYVLQVTGTVIKRESPNKNIPTGEIEIDVEKLVIINEAEQTPILIQDKIGLGKIFIL